MSSQGQRSSHIIDPEDWDGWVVVRHGLVVYTASTKKSCKAHAHSELENTKRHASRIAAGRYLMCGRDGSEVVCLTIGRPEAVPNLES